MRTTLQILLAACLLVGSATAQTPFATNLRAFLSLTDDQLQTVLLNSDEYNRYSIEKQQRIQQVQTEIAQETAKENLDPTTLGIRCAEIEVNCRQLKQKAAEIQSRNLAVLTDDQKAKLNTLQSLIPLIPLISDAQMTNLLGGGQTPPILLSGTFTSSVGSIGLFNAPGVSACSPRVTTAIRSGDFSPSPTVTSR